jgi:hypothetical protein
VTQAQRLLLQVWHPRLVAGYRGLGGTPNQSFQNGNLGLAPSTGCKGSNALRSSSSYWSGDYMVELTKEYPTFAISVP